MSLRRIPQFHGPWRGWDFTLRPAAGCTGPPQLKLIAFQYPFLLLEIDFDIPVGNNCGRYCIRMEEMRQSVRIMKQSSATTRRDEAVDGSDH